MTDELDPPLVLPTTEHAPIGPEYPYALSKRLGEEVITLRSRLALYERLERAARGVRGALPYCPMDENETLRIIKGVQDRYAA